jgi:hypothetical protein
MGDGNERKKEAHESTSVGPCSYVPKQLKPLFHIS